MVRKVNGVFKENYEMFMTYRIETWSELKTIYYSVGYNK